MRDEEIQKFRKILTPEQQQVAETLATLKVEREMYKAQVEELRKHYDDLFKMFILILLECPDNELRIHVSQLKRFKEEYRIERFIDEKAQEVVFKLRYITD